MVVHDLNILRAFRRPHEAHAELVVDANTVLTGTVALQRFQPIARRHAQVIKFPGPVQHGKLANGPRFDAHKPLDTIAAEQRLRIGALKRPDGHKQILTPCVSVVKGRVQRGLAVGPRKRHLMWGLTNGRRSPVAALRCAAAIGCSALLGSSVLIAQSLFEFGQNRLQSLGCLDEHRRFWNLDAVNEIVS